MASRSTVFLGALPEKQVTELVEGDEGAGRRRREEHTRHSRRGAADKDYAGEPADLYAQVLAAGFIERAGDGRAACCYLDGTGNIEQAQKTLDMVPEAKRGANAARRRGARRSVLPAQTKDLGPVMDLEAKVAADRKTIRRASILRSR